MRISDWSSDVCSSDLPPVGEPWRKFVRRIGIALRTQSLAEPAQKRQHQQRAGYWRIMSKGVDLNVPRRSRRSEEHTSELQSLMRISYAVFCLKKKKKHKQ